jgi:WD40 repeat protein
MHAIKLELQRFDAQRTVRQVGVLQPGITYVYPSPVVPRLSFPPSQRGTGSVIQGSILVKYYGHSDRVRSVAWSPDGQLIASASDDQAVHIWNLASKKPILIYRDHADGLHDVAWSHDGKYIASAAGSSIDYYADNSVRIWDAASGDTIYIFRSHSDYVLALAWSPNGQQIASASSDHSVSVWRAR